MDTGNGKLGIGWFFARTGIALALAYVSPPALLADGDWIGLTGGNWEDENN